MKWPACNTRWGSTLPPGSRQHIWTFASGLYAGNGTSYYRNLQCPCDNGNTYPSPPFVGNDYFCESVTTSSNLNVNWRRFYPNATLWDGQVCEGGGSCCKFNNPPWFTKNLTTPTTDGIELRLCLHNWGAHANVALELLELYIQWTLVLHEYRFVRAWGWGCVHLYHRYHRWLARLPSRAISAKNTEVALLQRAGGANVSTRVTYLKMSSEKKAEIGKRAAEHGVLATVRYYASRLLNLSKRARCVPAYVCWRLQLDR